ncbi:YcnI family protein [Microbacterium rhizomatis]|uniref:YcnI family protein n=1 Tax=Microbacterium rhizomatis TaxID=1631477 RepID=A0A5J5J1D8_9MICO|nr:YcnI family protein [Microbacterium rhizomatis]KAA9107509.1 YcnI family protein [Microbacterium rhizomatis]
MFEKHIFRAVAGATAGLALAIGIPLAASAHVTVTPNTADPGSYKSVQFRVPNESEAASTVRLEVQLPTDTPFLSVLYEPVPGWTTTVTESTLPAPVVVDGNTITQAATKVVFEAVDGGIRPGQLQNFTLSLGPVPEVGSIVLPAIQTYDDGTVSEWTATPAQVAADDTLEPAPVLYVQDAAPGDAHGASHGASPAPSATATEGGSATASSDPSSGIALGVSIAGLVLAAGAAVLAAIALARGRSKVS